MLNARFGLIFRAFFACYTPAHAASIRVRLGKTTWLAATVAVLLPALAWLQYDWVNQLAAADRDRRERTLRAAASQFTAAVDAELSRISGSLQLDGAMVERPRLGRLRAALRGGHRQPVAVTGPRRLVVETERPRRVVIAGRGERDGRGSWQS